MVQVAHGQISDALPFGVTLQRAMSNSVVLHYHVHDFCDLNTRLDTLVKLAVHSSVCQEKGTISMD